MHEFRGNLKGVNIDFESGVTYALSGCPKGGGFDTKYALYVCMASSIPKILKQLMNPLKTKCLI